MAGAVCRRVEGGAARCRQRQQALEHRRHPLAVGDALGLDQAERGLGVEAFQHHHRAATGRHSQRAAQGGGVVQRCGRQVAHLAAAQAEQLDQVGREGWRAAPVRRQQGPHHALGHARGARGVEHQRTGGLVCERQRRGHCQQGFKRRKTRNLAADRQACRGRRLQQGLGLFAAGGINQHDAGAAVLDQVAQLAAGQRCGHRRQDRAGAPAGPGQRQRHRPVAQQRGDVVAAHQPVRAQHVGQPVGQCFQVGIGEGGRAAQQGQALRRLLRMAAQVQRWRVRRCHAQSLRSRPRRVSVARSASTVRRAKASYSGAVMGS